MHLKGRQVASPETGLPQDLQAEEEKEEDVAGTSVTKGMNTRQTHACKHVRAPDTDS